MSISRINSVVTRIEQIGSLPQDDDELRLQKSLLFLSSLMMASLGILWGLLYIYYDQMLAGLIPLSYSLLSFASITFFILTRRYHLFRTSQLILSLSLPFLLMIALGGIISSSAVILWSLASPVGAMLFVGRRNAIGWFAVYIALVVSSIFIEINTGIISALPSRLIDIFFVLNIGGVSIIVFLLLQYFLAQKNQAYRLLSVEQDKTERLLLNVLPKEVAPILKEKESIIADRYEEASILFADIVNFTSLSTQMSPEEMVALLNKIFSYYDDLVDKFDLEKIRTIGDNYMVISGVPRRRKDHAQVLAHFALEMLEYLKSLPPQYGHKIEFRFGINSGPVVAGVIGKRKFHYDVWGDAVNTASRMESNGIAGKIQITSATYDLIKDDFVCEQRGVVEIKSKGNMQTWFLLRPR